MEEKLKRLSKQLRRLVGKRSIMDIDLGRLEEEWSTQAERHRILSEVVAIRRKLHAEAKAALDVAEAVSAKAIRKRPDKYGSDGKLTEPMVKASISLHPTYKEASQRVIDAKYDLDIAEAAVSASEHRKKALESEVSLWSQAYFAKPKKSRDERFQ